MSNVPARRGEVGLELDDVVIDAEIVDDPPPDDNPDRARLRAALEERRAKSQEIGQINNSDLYAGSPMYFYCKYCGALADTLPENYLFSDPKTTCEDCRVLIELGWHDGQTPSFPRRRVNAIPPDN